MRCGLCKYWNWNNNDCYISLSSDDRFGLAYCRYGEKTKTKRLDELFKKNYIGEELYNKLKKKRGE